MSFRNGRVVKLRWTGAITTGNDKVPDVDYIIYLNGVKAISVQLNTVPVVTGAPTVDLHTIGTNDMVTWGGATSAHYQNNIFTAQAKNTNGYAALLYVPRALKFRADVNTAEIAAGEYFEVTVYIDDMSPGGQDKGVA